MEIKNRELGKILNGLKSIKNLKNWKTKMTVIRNIKVIEREIDIHEEMKKPSDEYLEFEKARMEIIKEFARKDEKDRPIQKFDKQTGQAYYDVPPEKEQELNSKVLDVAEGDYKDAIEAYGQQMKDYEEMLKSPISIELFSINEDDLMKADVDEKTLEAIYCIVELSDGDTPVKLLKPKVSASKTSRKTKK